MNDLHDALDRLAEDGVAGISLRNPAHEGASGFAAPRGRGPIVLALAAAAVLIVGIAGVLVLGDDGSDDPGESVVAGPDTGESPDDRDDDGEDDPAADDQTGVGGQGDVGGQSDDGTAGDGADGDAQLADALAAAVPAVLGGGGPSVSVPAAALPDGTRADLYDLDGARRGLTVDGFGVVVVPALDGADRSFCLVITDADGSAVDIDGAPASVCTSPAELVTDGWVGVAGDTGPRLSRGPWVVVGAVAPDVTGVEIAGAAVAFDGGLFIAIGADAAEVRLVRPEPRAAFVEACNALAPLVTALNRADDFSPTDLDRLIAAAGRTTDPAFAQVATELGQYAGGALTPDVYLVPDFAHLGWVGDAVEACRDQRAPGFAVVALSPWPQVRVPSADLSEFGAEQRLIATEVGVDDLVLSIASEVGIGPITMFEIDPSIHVARWTQRLDGSELECLAVDAGTGGNSGCGYRTAPWAIVPFPGGAGRRVLLATVDADVAFVVADVDGEQWVQQPWGGQVALVVGAGPGTVSFHATDGEVLSTRPLER